MIEEVDELGDEEGEGDLDPSRMAPEMRQMFEQYQEQRLAQEGTGMMNEGEEQEELRAQFNF